MPLVTVTVDGVKKTVEAGRYALKTFETVIGSKTPFAKLTITTAAPTQATTINGNDSFVIQGGEAFTSTAALK